MAALKFTLRIAATALALMSVGLALFGFWDLFPPFDWEVWSTALLLVGGLTSALLFLVAVAIDAVPAEPDSNGAP
jgi:hypothetical protein